MDDMRTDDPWKTVEDLYAWLVRHADRTTERAALLQMLKLSEEVGEVAEAVIGAYGTNPRKGTTHTREDVQAELCD